jgi:S1-C subfamily serine protease
MTQPPPPSAGPRAKILSTPLARIRLGLSSGFVLAAGALLAPEDAPTSLPAPQERAAPLIEEQVLMREVPQPFRGVHEVVARVRPFSVALHVPQPRAVATVSDFSATRRRSDLAGFGVIVSDGYVLTHAAALHGRTSTEASRTDTPRRPATIAAYEPETGLVLLATEAARGTPVPLASAALEPGTLAVAVGLRDGRDLALPVFVSSFGPDRYTVAATNGSVPPGMAVYNLDAELVAIVGNAGDAFQVRDAASRLMTGASAAVRHTSLGLVFQDLTGDLTRIFGETGALVTTVVDGGPAERAGIEPGDVLLAVDGTGVDSSETAGRLVRSMAVGSSATLRVRRGARVREFQVTAALAFEVAALARAEPLDGAGGLEARVLLRADLLEKAGVPATARVLTVNRRAITSRAQLEREIRSARSPIPLLVDHDGNRFFAAIPAPP